MIRLNITNVEDLIFYNSAAVKSLPEFAKLYDRWRLAKINSLRSLQTRTLLDFLNSLDETHLKELEQVLGDKIHLTKLNYNLTQNIDSNVVDVERKLNQSEWFENFVCFREDEQVYVSFWR